MISVLKDCKDLSWMPNAHFSFTMFTAPFPCDATKLHLELITTLIIMSSYLMCRLPENLYT